jgi:hypothetical protein
MRMWCVARVVVVFLKPEDSAQAFLRRKLTGTLERLTDGALHWEGRDHLEDPIERLQNRCATVVTVRIFHIMEYTYNDKLKFQELHCMSI